MYVGSMEIAGRSDKVFYLTDAEVTSLTGVSGVVLTADSTTNKAPGLDGKEYTRDIDTKDVNAPLDTVEAIATSKTLTLADSGKMFRSTAGSGITLTVPANAPAGFKFRAARWAGGNVTIAGGTNRTAVTVTDALYKVLTVNVWANADGATPEYLVTLT